MEHILYLNKMMESFRVICNINNLGVTHLEALIIMSVSENNFSKNEIAESLLKDKSYISKKVDNLYKRRYLKKAPISHSYFLTEKGYEIIKKLRSIRKNLIDDNFIHFKTKEEMVVSFDFVKDFEKYASCQNYRAFPNYM